MAATLTVADHGRQIDFTFDDVLRYHGHDSPGGAALAFKALERALPLLDPDGPCERREIDIATPFGGPGARDTFEMVTRAVAEGRFHTEQGLERPDLGRVRKRFVFWFSYRNRRATLTLRDGFVTEEFIDLAGVRDRSAEQERQLDELKLDLAERVLARSPDDVFDAA